MTAENMACPRAVMTGASSGIGDAFAARLARDQYDLVIVARRRECLETLAQKFQEQHSVRGEVTGAALTQPAQVQAVEKRVADDTALELLVNNAGFGGSMPCVALDPDQAEELIRYRACRRPAWGIRWQCGGKEPTDGNR
jgi:uncharacterized protein